MKNFEGLKNSFCTSRWTEPVIHFGRGEIKTCCRTTPEIIDSNTFKTKKESIFLNSDVEKISRGQMLQGIRPPSCQECWELEDKGLKSYRKLGPYENSENEGDQWLETVSKKSALDSYRPFALFLFLDNICDLKCSYCYYGLSTSWQKEDLERNVLSTYQQNDVKVRAPEGFEESFWNWIEPLKTEVHSIKFLGGEPTAIPKFYDFLDRFIEMYRPLNLSQKLDFNLVTNLNTKENLFEKFKRSIEIICEKYDFHIDVSMESIGNRAEYIRNGVSWDRWLKNYRQLLSIKNPNLHISLSPTINSLCVSSLSTFIELALKEAKLADKSLGIRKNLVTSPKRMSPFMLDRSYLAYIDDTIEVISHYEPEDPSWAEYIIFLENLKTGIANETNKASMRREFVDFINTTDKHRNTDLLATFPEYEKFWTEINTP